MKITINMLRAINILALWRILTVTQVLVPQEVSLYFLKIRWLPKSVCFRLSPLSVSSVLTASLNLPGQCEPAFECDILKENINVEMPGPYAPS